MLLDVDGDGGKAALAGVARDFSRACEDLDDDAALVSPASRDRAGAAVSELRLRREPRLPWRLRDGEDLAERVPEVVGDEAAELDDVGVQFVELVQRDGGLLVAAD